MPDLSQFKAETKKQQKIKKSHEPRGKNAVTGLPALRRKK